MGTNSAANISARIESEIADGRLEPGAHLVPVRQLAAELDVSPTTVAAAYRRLRELGIVVGRGRQGSIVAPRVQPPITQVLSVPSDVVDAMRGTPDETRLPDLRPALGAALSSPQARYGDALVHPDLKDAGRALFEADGVDATCLTVTSGAMDAVERTIMAAGLRRDARVGVEDPGHVPVHQLVRSAGLAPIPLSVDRAGVMPEALRSALERGLDAIIVTPRCQNPTGAAFTAERATDLSAALSRHPDVLVIQDDHAGLISGAPYFGITAPGSRHATIRSLGKAFGPDLRLALMVSDPMTHERVSVAISNGPGWVSHILQRAAAFLLADDSTRTVVADAEASYVRRRELLMHELHERGIDAMGASGVNVWIPTPDEQVAVEAARGAGFAIRAADSYRIDSGPAVRVTVSALTDPDIIRLADALAGSAAQPQMVSPSM